MLIKFSKTLIIGLISAAAFSPAYALTTSYGSKVNAVNDVVFEVVGQNSAASGQEYWCGASEFARRALKAGWRDQIFLVRGRGPSETTNRKSAVQFTLNPQAAGVSPAEASLSLNAMNPGENLTVQRAHQYCSAIPGRF